MLAAVETVTMPPGIEFPKPQLGRCRTGNFPRVMIALTPVLCRACWSLLHPWIVRRVGVHGRAAVIDGLRAQFVVPGFVAVDLAQPVLGAVLGQPRRGTGGPDVDRVPRHVSRRVGSGHPPGGFLL